MILYFHPKAVSTKIGNNGKDNGCRQASGVVRGVVLNYGATSLPGFNYPKLLLTLGGDALAFYGTVAAGAGGANCCG